MSGRQAKILLSAWSEDCPEGVEIGKRLFESGELDKLVKENAAASVVYDFIYDHIRIK